jgi:translocation protein SEC63
VILKHILTDEKIKENWIKYNHPDGPQSTTMGIALPRWIIEGKNNIWALGEYGLVFGVALPALVVCLRNQILILLIIYKVNVDRDAGGSVIVIRQKIELTLSPLQLSSGLLMRNHPWRKSWGKAYRWELPLKARASEEVDQLEKSIEGKLGSKWTEVRKLAQDYDGQLHISRREVLILLYSHLLRLDIQDASLQKRASISLKNL